MYLFTHNLYTLFKTRNLGKDKRDWSNTNKQIACHKQNKLIEVDKFDLKIKNIKIRSKDTLRVSRVKSKVISKLTI